MKKYTKNLCLLACLFLFSTCNDSDLELLNNQSEPSAVCKSTIAPVVHRASDFRNSIGINTHITYHWTNYQKWDEFVRDRLINLGIKHIRDSYDLGTPNDQQIRMKYNELGKLGFKLLLTTTADNAVKKVKALGSIVWGVEGINEPDFFLPDTTNWHRIAQAEQKKLFKSIRRDKATKHLPIVGLSVGNPWIGYLRVGDLSDYMDYGNMHSYPGTTHPSLDWGWTMTIYDAFAFAGVVSKNKPIIATETGYHNAINYEPWRGVSEKAAAIYHLHTFFVYFNAGIYRTYMYEFLDSFIDENNPNDKESLFGLVRKDGSVKPSYTALQNLMSLLWDKEDTKFTPTSLTFGLDVPNSENVQYTLLQKTDGSWWLALFRVLPVFDGNTQTDITVNPINVTLSLQKNANIEVYIPNNSKDPAQAVYNTNKVVLDLGAELQLLKISR